MMKTKVIITKQENPVMCRGEVYAYNAQIFHQIDRAGYCYCGEGRFCQTLAEAEAYAKTHGDFYEIIA